MAEHHMMMNGKFVKHLAAALVGFKETGQMPGFSKAKERLHNKRLMQSGASAKKGAAAKDRNVVAKDRNVGAKDGDVADKRGPRPRRKRARTAPLPTKDFDAIPKSALTDEIIFATVKARHYKVTPRLCAFVHRKAGNPRARPEDFHGSPVPF